jgi:membrane peptidoglycan carboxypeptidase
MDKAHHVAYPGQPVPQRFAASLVATEDHRFYSEAGIDPFGIAGVTAGFLMGKPDHGGSTLNQQLAKFSTSRSAQERWRNPSKSCLASNSP